MKGAVLLDELQHHVGVLDGRLDLASVADHGRVLRDRFDLLRTQVRDVPRVEAVKRLQEPGPLVLDDLPVQPGGENRLGQLLEIGARVARVRLSALAVMRLRPGCIGGHTLPPFTSGSCRQRYHSVRRRWRRRHRRFRTRAPQAPAEAAIP